MRRLAPQDAGAERVKRRNPHRPAIDAEQRFDPLAHLGGGFVREGHRHDLVGMHDLFRDEIRDPMRDDARLPRPRAGENQQRPFAVLHGLLLLWIERGKEVQPPYSTVTLFARFLG